MEYPTESRFLRMPVTVLDTVAEQLADVDLTLPDYCPDIEKILKCTLIPKLQSKSLSGGQLLVDGCCVVSVLYVESTGKTIRCCEQSINFSQNFSLHESPENYVVLTKTKPEYINCRALSPRRLVIRGAFSLYAKVLSVEQVPLYTPPTDLEVLAKSMECADLTALCQEQFTVSEDISAADKPPVESVLHAAVTVGINDVKAVTGKLMVGGELNLQIFYLCDVESGETAKLDYILPFNQIVDCEGVDEQTRNLISCEVMSFDVRLKNDIMSEKPVIALDVKLCLTAQGYVMREENLICDAFSVSHASAPHFENLKTISAVQPVSDSFMEKMSVCVDSGKISKILDIYADTITMGAAPAEGNLCVNGKVNLCMLALDGDGFPMFVERNCDYSHMLSSSEGCDSLCFEKVRSSGLSFRLSDDSTAEIRMELKITGGAVKNDCTRVVTDVEVFEDRPVVSEDCALTLYFADAGENLWDISKAHNTRLSMLMRENNRDAIELESAQMLLIPKL